MKSKDQLLLEQAYNQVLQGTDYAQLKYLIELDHLAIEQLIEEAGFFKNVADKLKGAASSAGSVIKSGYSKAKETISKGMITGVVNAIMAAMPDNMKIQLLQMIASGTVPQESKQIASEINSNQQTSSAVASNENVEINKQFLASLLFEKQIVVSILEDLQKEGFVLNEMMANPAAGTNQVSDYADEVINNIKKRYGNNQYALQAFVSKLSKALNVAPTTSSNNVASGSASPQQVTSSSNSVSSSPQQTLQTSNSAPQQSPTNSSQQGTGFVSKIMGFVKKHPKISAAAGVVLVGLLVSAFAGTAPVVVPALITASKSALIGGGADTIKQIVKNKMSGGHALDNIDFRSIGKSAATGAAFGALGSVLSAGLGNIVKALTPYTYTTNTSYVSSHGSGEQTKTWKQFNPLEPYTKHGTGPSFKYGDDNISQTPGYNFQGTRTRANQSPGSSWFDATSHTTRTRS